jgi:enoyl-CoA hydratase
VIHRSTAADTEGRVGLLEIDRPERRNAVDEASCRELEDGLRGLVADGARVVVLTGRGGHFCAGADLKGVEDDGFRSALRSLLDALVSVEVPVMAAVEGAALGAGTQLAAACDLRVAAPDARFGIPAAKLGLMVDHWTVQRVARLAGFGPAQAMLLAADEVSGERAHALGLVHRLGALSDAIAWAGDVARLAPLTLAGHKLALTKLEPGLDDAEVARAVVRAWTSDDLAEGMAAFRERRRPDFKGR